MTPPRPPNHRMGRRKTTHPYSDATDRSGRSNRLAPVADLLDREATIPFAGLTPGDSHEYPIGVTPDNPWFSQSPISLKEAIKPLP